jgi:hypothetical protein
MGMASANIADLFDGAKVMQPVRRNVRRRKVVASAVDAAAEMIGSITPGDDITGVTNGQFSLIDIIEHVLGQTGPADLVVSTWTMGIYDAERASKFCANGAIRSIRWLVDPSMFGRRPELAGRLVAQFGVDSFRAANTHAKFATIRGDDLQVCIRSSMNLNPNKRMENFDISADETMVRWFERIADSVFEVVDAANRSQSHEVFAGILAEYERAKPEAETGGMFPAYRNPFGDA